MRTRLHPVIRNKQVACVYNNIQLRQEKLLPPGIRNLARSCNRFRFAIAVLPGRFVAIRAHIMDLQSILKTWIQRPCLFAALVVDGMLLTITRLMSRTQTASTMSRKHWTKQ